MNWEAGHSAKNPSKLLVYLSSVAPGRPELRIALLAFWGMCLGSDRPDRQTVHPRAEGAHGFNLIPVSGVSEAVSDEKKGGNGSKEHSTETWSKMKWLLWHTKQKPSSPWAKRVITSGVRACAARKKCECVRTVKCCLYKARRVHGSCHCLDAKLPERKIVEVRKDYTWSPNSGELDNNWDLFGLTSPYKSPCTSLCVTLALSRLLLISPFFVLHPWECHSCHRWSQDEELHHVGLSDHVEDEDDEKYVFQLKLNHSKCRRTAVSNVSLCFVRKCIGILGTPLLCTRWMLTSAFADGLSSGRWHSGPFVYWNLLLSWGACFHTDFAVCKAVRASGKKDTE